MVDRVDPWHHSPEKNLNILFNMIQKCRTDASIIRFDINKFCNLYDNELVKAAEALAQEVQFLRKD